MPGFGPAAEPLWFRSKWPNPCWPCCGPSDPLRGSPTPAAHKLATLKQCAPFLRCCLHCSATPQGQKRLWKRCVSFIESQLAEPVLRLRDVLRQGPLFDQSIRPRSRTAGVGQERAKSLGAFLWAGVLLSIGS
jgi:hypothetical protein